MRDVWILLRKEFYESFNNRTALLRYYGFAILFAVALPLQDAGAGLAALMLTSLLWVGYSGVIIAMGATMQAFYTEKVRRTIETLLATPLSDAALVGGKVLFSFLLSYTGILIAMACQLIVFNVIKVANPSFFPGVTVFVYPSLALFGFLVMLPALQFYVVTVGTLISLKVTNLRLANILMLVATFVPFAVALPLVHPEFTFAFLSKVFLALLIIDAVFFFLAVKFFHRETVVLSIP